MGDPDPLSQMQVEHNIDSLCGQLNKLIVELRDASHSAAMARYEYKSRWAREFLKTDGTIPEREAQTTRACDAELRNSELASTRESYLRKTGDWLCAQLDGQRSLNTNIRASISHASGVGG